MSRRRGALLAVAMLLLAALPAACAPSEEAEAPPPAAVLPSLSEPVPEPDPLAVLVSRSTLRTWAEAGAGQPPEEAPAPEAVSDPEEYGKNCFTDNAWPECPPFLLNDPPPPIHTGGEPYPPGTFPPEVLPVWEVETKELGWPASYWGNGGTCFTAVYRFGYVRNQWAFLYEEELDDPLTVIVGELLAAEVEFESVTVTTKEYYDQYDPETFINWLLLEGSRFDPVAALTRLGGDVHPGASATFFNFHDSPAYSLSPEVDFYYAEDFQPMQHGPVNAVYQVKVHGLSGDGEERVSGLFNSRRFEFSEPCIPPRYRLKWLVGGLYTTFGDDLVLYEFTDAR